RTIYKCHRWHLRKQAWYHGFHLQRRRQWQRLCHENPNCWSMTPPTGPRPPANPRMFIFSSHHSSLWRAERSRRTTITRKIGNTGLHRRFGSWAARSTGGGPPGRQMLVSCLPRVSLLGGSYWPEYWAERPAIAPIIEAHAEIISDDANNL